MAHPAYDPKEDLVRVELEIDEKSIKVKDVIPRLFKLRY